MSALQGGNAGVADLLGAPVDLVNNAPRLANLLPGVSGVGPISDNPIGGAEGIKATGRAMRDALGGHGYEPQNPVERIAERVGREVGSTAVPLAGLLATGARLGVQGAKELGPVARMFVEPAAVNPAGLAGREIAYGTAAGTGAGVANEAVGNPQSGHNFWSDFLGSIGGAGTVAVAAPFSGLAAKVAGAAVGRPVFRANDVVREAVANDLIDASTAAQRQFATTRMVDTDPIAQSLRRPSAAEEAVPGFRADIADRTQDPGLQSYVYNNASPGAQNARVQANREVVDQRMAGFEPEGNAGAFRESIQAGTDRQLAEVQTTVEQAAARLDDTLQRTAPTMSAEERGAMVREAAQRLDARLRAATDEAYRPINESGAMVNPAPLADAVEARTGALSTAERERDLPAGAGIPRRLVGNTDPVDTGLLDAAGNPIVRPPRPEPVPLREITGLRTTLTGEQAAAAATPGGRNAARIAGGLREDVDAFIEQALPPELQQQLAAARAAKRTQAEITERPGDPISQVLQTYEGGRPKVPDSSVAQRFVQPDSGQASNAQRVIEATGDPTVRTALADQIRAEITEKGFGNNPRQLDRYLDQRRGVLTQFPGLEEELRGVGKVARETRDATQRGAARTRDLTTPGRSPEASYLRYDDTRTVDAVRTVVNSPRPPEAMRQLLDTAGRTPETINNARAAFWQVIDTEGRGGRSAASATGEQPWDAKRLLKAVDDPKRQAVLRELYADNPEVLDDMRQVFTALVGAESGTRLGRAVNSSGTAQKLNAKQNPATSAASLASSARSMSHGYLTPTTAAIYHVSGWLRHKSAAMQQSAVQNLKDAVINNPEMAADLLTEYNPATYAAKRTMILQKYGVRANQVLNVLDEMHDETSDPVKGALRNGR
jgi:hypothetical protein